MFDRVLNTIYKEMEHNILGFSLSSFGTLLTKIVKKNNLFENVLPICQIYQFINVLSFNRQFLIEKCKCLNFQWTSHLQQCHLLYYLSSSNLNTIRPIKDTYSASQNYKCTA